MAKHAELGVVRKRYEQRPVLASVTGALKLHFNEICCFRSSGSRKTHRDWRAGDPGAAGTDASDDDDPKSWRKFGVGRRKLSGRSLHAPVVCAQDVHLAP